MVLPKDASLFDDPDVMVLVKRKVAGESSCQSRVEIALFETRISTADCPDMLVTLDGNGRGSWGIEDEGGFHPKGIAFFAQPKKPD
jgi:hypothetical protein